MSTASVPLFIPKKLKIGFQNRSDTHTGKLGYVIYYDEKNKLRKEKSWESWRDQTIEPIEVENNPISGYVLNKGIRRHTEWYGSGRTVVRIWDPRDFEFEVGVDNLLGILSHSDVSSGEVFEKCVFAWYGTELVLLPCNSEQYQKSIQYTEIQDGKLSTKDLKPGMVYQKKKSLDVKYAYIGFFNWYEYGGSEVFAPRYGTMTKKQAEEKLGRNFIYQPVDRDIKSLDVFYKSELIGKKHVFFNIQNNTFESVSPSTLSPVVIDDKTEELASLIDKFNQTTASSPVTGFEIISDVDETGPSRSERLYKIEGETLISIANWYYEYSYDRNEKFAHQKPVQARVEKHIKSGLLVNCYTSNNSSYSYSYRLQSAHKSYYLSLAHDIYNEKDPISTVHYTYMRPSKSMRKKLFDEHGFGKLALTLENGNKAIQTSLY
ncbi:hypothetical protein [Synechococcus phage BUCT-ZZ01]|nr:hypothetical protein [Synechococcus phage BUCT-ZZ01]